MKPFSLPSTIKQFLRNLRAALMGFVPNRYVFHVVEYGGLVFVGIFFAIATAAVLIYVKPNPIEDIEFRMGEVIWTKDISDEERGFRVVASVRLDDGSSAQVWARSFLHAQLLTKPVCIQRNTHENGRIGHRLVIVERCVP